MQSAEICGDICKMSFAATQGTGKADRDKEKVGDL